jgi:hypothetical protein
MSRRITCLATALALVGAAQAETALAEPAGLWSTGFEANPAPEACASFASDGRFCYTPGGDGSRSVVELGVKFTSSKSVDVVGVRAYRTDPGLVTGSLWTSDGTRRATAAFAGANTHSWQDVLFDPVAVQPGQTYVASYFSPSANYAFEYGTFGQGPYSVGPITALQSVAGDGNGVFCYDASCFPTTTFPQPQGTNYWVTPLWAYRFVGFYPPVDNNGVWNTAKAGSAIPVKFTLGGDQGLDVTSTGSPTLMETACPGGSAPVDAIEEIVTASASKLTYDPDTGQYDYIWKTDKAWAGKCYRFTLGLNDQTSHAFNVKFLR